MRTSTLLLALPALSAAQQFPFLDQVKEWFGQASATISSAIPSAASDIPIPNPIASGAKKLASVHVSRLTLENHDTVLQPGAATASPGIEEWMVFVTGGNKTCYGMCGRSELAWNESVALLAAAPAPPHLALLDCETDPVLCNSWLASPPSVLHLLLPQPLADQSTPDTTVRYINVNRTSVKPTDIAAIHLQEKYKETAPYEGYFHPFNGVLATTGLAVPFGYALWGFSLVPSWLFMILVSFASRSMMSRRMGQAGANRPAPGGAPAAAS